MVVLFVRSDVERSHYVQSSPLTLGNLRLKTLPSAASGGAIGRRGSGPIISTMPSDGFEPPLADAAASSNVCIYQLLAGDDSTVLSQSPAALYSVGKHQTDLRI